MTNIADLEKTGPITLLENRREHLIRWMADAQDAIKKAEETIITAKQQTLDMLAEIDEIEAALNALYREQQHNKQEKPDGG